MPIPLKILKPEKNPRTGGGVNVTLRAQGKFQGKRVQVHWTVPMMESRGDHFHVGTSKITAKPKYFGLGPQMADHMVSLMQEAANRTQKPVKHAEVSHFEESRQILRDRDYDIGGSIGKREYVPSSEVVPREENMEAFLKMFMGEHYLTADEARR